MSREPASGIRPFRADRVKPPRDFGGPLVVPSGFVALDVEVGCGVGWHPMRYAERHPDRYLVAIERTREKFEKFRRRYESHGRPANLMPVHADAVAWITHALAPRSVDRFYFPYPNPEPKNPQARWIRMPFFARVVDSLKPGGEILFSTNLEGYAREVAAYAAEWGLGADTRSFGRADVAEARTHFEKKYLERGETCYDVRLAVRG